MAAHTVDSQQPSSRSRPVSRAAGVVLLVCVSAALVHCGSVDDRQVGTLEGDPSAAMPPEQDTDSLQPSAATSGGAGGVAPGATTGTTGTNESPINPAPPAAPVPPTASGAAGAAQPQPQPPAPDAEVCAVAENGESCTTDASLEGACTEGGACTEFCTVGPSRLGQCLVKPG
jgi:hypothetical protein